MKLDERGIEAATAALDEATQGRCYIKPAIDDVARAVVAAVDAAREPCRWTYGRHSEMWETTCEEAWEFFADGPKENRCKFCHGCGAKIEVIADPLPLPPVPDAAP